MSAAPAPSPLRGPVLVLEAATMLGSVAVLAPGADGGPWTVRAEQAVPMGGN